MTVDVRQPDAPPDLRALEGAEPLAPWFAREILASLTRPAPTPSPDDLLEAVR